MGFDAVGPLSNNPISGVKPQATSKAKSDNTSIFGKLFSALTSIVKAILSPILGVLALCKLGGDPYPPAVKKPEATNSNKTETNNSNPTTSTAPFSRAENPPVTDPLKKTEAPPIVPAPAYKPGPTAAQASQSTTDEGQANTNGLPFCLGDSQASTVTNPVDPTNRKIFFEDKNGCTRIGAEPEEIYKKMEELVHSGNLTELKKRGIILSPGADNAGTNPATSEKWYSKMHTLLVENDIRYTIIPPGKSDKQAHIAMLKTIFNENNVLETKNVRRGSDDTHYQRGQLLQALTTHLSKRQQQDVG